MQDAHAHSHDAHGGHGHDDALGHGGHDHAHGGQVAPLEIAWTGIGIVVLAIALVAAVGWWAAGNKPTWSSAPTGKLIPVAAQHAQS